MPLLPKPHPGILGLRNLFPPLLLGFMATSFQILLLREFNAHFYGNELTYGLVLASWLLWGGVGSLLGSRWQPLGKDLAPVTYRLIFFFCLALAGVRAFRFLLGVLPGELIGLFPVLGLALGVCFLVSLPLGMLFVLTVKSAGGNIERVYRLESLGAALAGGLVYFVLFPRFSAWQAAALVGGASTLLMFACVDRKRSLLCLAPGLLSLTALITLDLTSQKLYWKPYRLIAGQDSRYGKLQVIKAAEQLSLYNNSSPVYSHPDLASAEESVHFALLQRPEAERVLLIGGGAGGTVREILKYRLAQLDYVELDPAIIRLSEQLLPPKERSNLKDSRVRLFFQDGRAFLLKTSQVYDIILLSLPEPSTAQLNRFYTREFFFLAKKKLTRRGLLSFIVSSSEDYIGGELQQFLATLYRTLSEVFPEVAVIPGNRNIFLASSEPLSVDPEELSRKVETLGLETVYFTRSFLIDRLHPLRRVQLKKTIESAASRVNTDLAPISFYFQVLLWSAHFRGLEAGVLKAFSQLSPSWLIGGFVLISLMCFAFLGLRKKKDYLPLVALALMGFTTMVTEIILLIWFQALFGYLYGAVALLLSVFMLGLYGGSWFSSTRPGPSYGRLILVQAGFVTLLLVFRLLMTGKPPAILAFFLLFALGFLGGDLFIVSSRLYLRTRADYGLGYGLDLLGSFFGALLTSTLLIPLAGLPPVLTGVFLVNLVCLLSLLLSSRL